MTAVGIIHLVIVVAIAIVLVSLWVLAVRSILRAAAISGFERGIWIAVAIVFPVVGSLVWFWVGRGRVSVENGS